MVKHMSDEKDEKKTCELIDKIDQIMNCKDLSNYYFQYQRKKYYYYFYSTKK